MWQRAECSGISKESWMAALEKENYFGAAEMSMEDDYGMIDGSSTTVRRRKRPQRSKT